LVFPRYGLVSFSLHQAEMRICLVLAFNGVIPFIVFFLLTVDVWIEMGRRRNRFFHICMNTTYSLVSCLSFSDQIDLGEEGKEHLNEKMR